MTLETKINDRLKELEAETAKAQAEAEARAETQRREFEQACQELTQLAAAIGAKDAKPVAYGDSATPYVTFDVSGIPCALERQGEQVTVLVNGQRQEPTLSLTQDNLTGNLEGMIVEAIATAVHSGALQLSTPTKSKGTKEPNAK